MDPQSLENVMKIGSNGGLPSAVRRVLPAEAQTEFRRYFNTFVEKHPDTTKARAIAMSWVHIRRRWSPPSVEAGTWSKKIGDELIEDYIKISNDGVFSGYACKWGEVAVLEDGTEITMDPGAFGDVDFEQVKMLWQHDAIQPIGVWTWHEIDDIGLRMRGKLILEVEQAAEAKALIEEGAVDGLSMGFDILESETVNDIVVVTKIDLWEVSVVTYPAISEARMDSLGDGATTMKMNDTVVLDGIRRTQDGYLTASVKVARSGIQIYKGIEMGRPDLDEVRVYRPADEVFSKKALNSFAHRPVTIDHPSEAVTADNWKQYAVGSTGDEVARDGEFIRVPLVLMDSAAIQAVEGGKRELSMGYTTDIKWTHGKTPDGEEYDAVQTKIMGNHLAIVSAARGGPQLKIGDDEGAKTMNEKITHLQVDGIDLEMNDVAAKVVSRHVAKLEKEVENLKAQLEAEGEDGKKTKAKAETDAAAMKTQLDEATAKIATLEKQLDEAKVSPSTLDAMVADRTSAIEAGRKFLGDKLVTDGKAAGDIRRQVVEHVMGDTAKGWSDEQIAASFGTLSKSAPTGQSQLGAVLGDTVHNSADARDAAYNERVKKLGDAWKRPAA